MPPIAIGLIVLACVFGGGLLGIFLRSLLPEHHLNEPSKDVARLVTSLVATLAALVLGLLIASAKNSFDRLNEGLKESAAKIVLLDRALAQYGPETKEARELLREGLAGRIERLFPKDGSRPATLRSTEATVTIEGFQQKLRALSPQNEAQRSFQARALELTDAISQARWFAIEHEDSTIPTPFLVVLVFWLAAMFVSFGLFAQRNAVVISVLFFGALSLSASIFLIEDMSDPGRGLISISRAPLDTALSQLGQ